MYELFFFSLIVNEFKIKIIKLKLYQYIKQKQIVKILRANISFMTMSGDLYICIKSELSSLCEFLIF